MTTSYSKPSGRATTSTLRPGDRMTRLSLKPGGRAKTLSSEPEGGVMISSSKPDGMASSRAQVNLWRELWGACHPASLLKEFWCTGCPVEGAEKFIHFFIIPSIVCNAPVPLAVKQTQSMMLPPPCLTVLTEWLTFTPPIIPLFILAKLVKAFHYPCG